MAKRNNSIMDIIDTRDVDPVKTISSHLNKKGRLRGSKKEVKALKSICPHHVLNRKGKVKVRVHKEGDKNCQCDICKDKFQLGFYKDQQYDEAYAAYKPMISQAKLIMTAVGAGKETVQEITALNILADRSQKTMKNLRNVAQKQQNKKKKKKNKRQSKQLGGWSMK